MLIVARAQSNEKENIYIVKLKKKGKTNISYINTKGRGKRIYSNIRGTQIHTHETYEKIIYLNENI